MRSGLGFLRPEFDKTHTRPSIPSDGVLQRKPWLESIELQIASDDFWIF